MAVTVGIVIGAGILRTPGIIAGHLGNPWVILAAWFFGGVVVALSTLVLAISAAGVGSSSSLVWATARSPGSSPWKNSLNTRS